MSAYNGKGKVLILKSDRSEFEEFYIKHMQAENIDTCPIYKVKSGLGWYAAVMWIEKLKLPGGQLFYGAWKKQIRNYDTVIVFDRNYGRSCRCPGLHHPI